MNTKSLQASRVRRSALTALAGLSLGLLSFARPAIARDPTILEMLTGFSAKETCSCAFVVEQTDTYCKEFGVPPGYSVDIAIDRGARTVAATAGSTTRAARFDAHTGCILDRLP